MSFFASLYYVIYISIHSEKFYDVMDTGAGNLTKEFFLTFIKWMLMLGRIIPFSFWFTINFVKYCQAIRVEYITSMKSFLKDENGVIIQDDKNGENILINSRVNNPSINEDLGQVEHVFSDKTGTLTKNVMQFERIVIGMYEFCKAFFNAEGEEQVNMLD